MLPSCGSCNIYGCIEVSMYCFYCFYFSDPLWVGEEGIKIRDFQFYFYFSLPNNNVGGSVNQSIIKKGLNDCKRALTEKNVKKTFSEIVYNLLVNLILIL